MEKLWFDLPVKKETNRLRVEHYKNCVFLFLVSRPKMAELAIEMEKLTFKISTPSRIIPPHPISPHLIIAHLTSCHLTLYLVTLSHSHDILKCALKSISAQTNKFFLKKVTSVNRRAFERTHFPTDKSTKQVLLSSMSISIGKLVFARDTPVSVLVVYKLS